MGLARFLLAVVCACPLLCAHIQDGLSNDVFSRDATERPCASQSGWVLLQTNSRVARSVAVGHAEQFVGNRSVAAAVGLVGHRAPHSQPIINNDGLTPWSGSEFRGPDGRANDGDFEYIRKNAAGDFAAVVTSLVCCCASLLALLVAFHKMRQAYPLMFLSNLSDDAIALGSVNAPSSSLLGWWRASMKLSTDDVELMVGLDRAMLLEFLHLSIQLLTIISGPMVVMCFLHHAYGQRPAVDDGLGRIDMANIGDSWLYWVHAGLVWFVVIMSQRTIAGAAQMFLARRYRWLKRLPRPRSTSVLVEAIPPSIRTDVDLRKYFEELFPLINGAIVSVYRVRKTKKLSFLVKDLSRARQSLLWAECGHQQGIDECRIQVKHLELEVSTERARIRNAVANSDPDVFAASALVTFLDRRDRETALCMKCTKDDGQMVISVPPDPSDIRYADLQTTHAAYWRLLGHSLLLLMLISFLPIVVAVSSMLRLHTLEIYIPALHRIVVGFPLLKSWWDGVMSSFILSCMLGIVPPILTTLCRCYALKATTSVQHYVQIWYFDILLVYGLLVTAMGNSLHTALRDILENPSLIFHRLATNLPMASHFYINYLVYQMFAYGLSMLRLFPLAKFITWRRMFDDARARELAEPENDPYDGMGCRSAVFAFHLVVPLVLSNVSPPICIVGLAGFVIARACYGYLVVFAEPAQPDLGGKFWCTQLHQVQQGIFVYVILMAGILVVKSSSWLPSFLAFASLFYHLPKYLEFQRGFKWEALESLPMEELLKAPQSSELPQCGEFVQPELQDG